MKKVYLVICILIIVLVASLISGCSQSASTSPPAANKAPAASAPQAAKTITLKVAYDTPPTALPGVFFTWFAKELETRTNGRVKCELYPGAALFSGQQVLNAMAGRTADVSAIYPGVFLNDFILTNVGGLPGMGFPDNAPGKLAYGKAMETIYSEFPEVKGELQKYVVLGFGATSFQIEMWTKKELRVPDDLKGHKGGGALNIKKVLLDSNGGAGVAVIPPDLYENLDKGVIDIGFATPGQLDDYKLWEVSKYGLNAGFGESDMITIMNKDAWNELPADIQKTIQDVTEAGIQYSVSNQVVNHEGEGLQNFASHGGTQTKINPDEQAKWDKAYADVVYPQWFTIAQGRNLQSAQKVLDRFKQLRAAAMK